MRSATFLLIIISSAKFSAQQDSIFIKGKLSADGRNLQISERISYQNTTDIPQEKIKLLNPAAAYKRKNTALAKRKLEDRNSDLYFAKKTDIGSVEDLKINGEDFSEIADRENIFFPAGKPIFPGERRTILLNYSVKLPSDKFTGYGRGDAGTLLKDFFIVPDCHEDAAQAPKFFRDLGETLSGGNYWEISLEAERQMYFSGNLPQSSENTFQGAINTDPEIFISAAKPPEISQNIDGQKITIDFGYALTADEKQNLEFLIPLQLRFIKEKTGFLPDKIFISEKFRKTENFFGNNDITFWKFKFPLFTPAENTDFDYISLLAKKVLQSNFIENKETDHWLINGLKTYIESAYLKKNYPDKLLLGNLPDEVKIFGYKPLKNFNAAKIKLSERYGLGYQFMMTQNLDQRIGENFSEFGNFNKLIISHFEAGMLFQSVAGNMGVARFDGFLRNYLMRERDKKINTKTFLSDLNAASGGVSKFFESYLNHKQRIDLRLKSVHTDGKKIDVAVTKNTSDILPFTLTAKGEKHTAAAENFTLKNDSVFSLPASHAVKVALNDSEAFPESNYRNNYLGTQGIFSNMRKIKLKLVKDIPNPEDNEIYLSPRLNFNVYDKILLGVNVKNTALFDQKFKYSLTPYFSTGTREMAGSGSISYTFQPAESFFRSWSVGASGSSFHYDYGLSYHTFSVFSGYNFLKDSRSAVSKFLSLSWNHYEKDLSPVMVQNGDYGKYNLVDLGFGYSNPQLIHEKYFSADLQGMEDFKKISAEAFYRWEYLQKKKISFRLFAGYFLENHTRNNFFDYGISHVSNYSFSYGLLGQSASGGILSQQFVLADGGFKSVFPGTANRFITSFNTDAQLWKMFNVYADAGVVKNDFSGAKFLWDSGIKLKVIPDFFEIYFPVQSSLGFEPGFKDYGYRIRYTLIFNLNAAIGYFRRGWF